MYLWSNKDRMNGHGLQKVFSHLVMLASVANSAFSVPPADRQFFQGRPTFTHEAGVSSSEAAGFGSYQLEPQSNLYHLGNGPIPNYPGAPSTWMHENTNPMSMNYHPGASIYHEARLVNIPVTLTGYAPCWVYYPRGGTHLDYQQMAPYYYPISRPQIQMGSLPGPSVTRAHRVPKKKKSKTKKPNYFVRKPSFPERTTVQSKPTSSDQKNSDLRNYQKLGEKDALLRSTTPPSSELEKDKQQVDEKGEKQVPDQKEIGGVKSNHEEAESLVQTSAKNSDEIKDVNTQIGTKKIENPDQSGIFSITQGKKITVESENKKFEKQKKSSLEDYPSSHASSTNKSKIPESTIEQSKLLDQENSDSRNHYKLLRSTTPSGSSTDLDKDKQVDQNLKHEKQVLEQQEIGGVKAESQTTASMKNLDKTNDVIGTEVIGSQHQSPVFNQKGKKIPFVESENKEIVKEPLFEMDKLKDSSYAISKEKSLDEIGTDIVKLKSEELNKWVEIKKKDRKNVQTSHFHIDQETIQSNDGKNEKIEQEKYISLIHRKSKYQFEDLSQEGALKKEAEELNTKYPDNTEESLNKAEKQESSMIKSAVEPRLPQELEEHVTGNSKVAFDQDESITQQSSSSSKGEDKFNATPNASEEQRTNRIKSSKSKKNSSKRKSQAGKQTRTEGSKKDEDQELELIVEKINKSDEDMMKEKIPPDDFTRNILEKMREIQQTDYERRNELFSEIIQGIFHPSDCEGIEEIYPKLSKNILGYTIDQYDGKVFAKEIDLKLPLNKDGMTINPQLNIKVNFNSLNSKFLQLVEEHLNTSNPEDYLSLSEMDFSLYKKLQIVWYLNPQIIQELPKTLRPQISREEFYRRLETFQNQIYSHTIVENWGIIKKHIVDMNLFTFEEAEAIEKDYQLSTHFPCAKDFSSYLYEKTAAQVGEDQNGKAHQLLVKVMGDQGAKYRLMLRYRADVHLGKDSKIWNSKILEEYYKYKGCSIVDFVDLLSILGLHFIPLNTGSLEPYTYLKQYFDPSELTSLVPWYQSSTRHLITKLFKKNYNLNLSKKYRSFNLSIGDRGEDKKNLQGVAKLMHRLHSKPGDMVKLQDWGFDMDILKLLYLFSETQVNNSRRSFNWDLIKLYYPINLNPNQKMEIELFFKRNN